MKRDELNFTLNSNHYIRGGTKEACVIAREFLVHAKDPGNQLHAPGSCVNAEEFIEAVKVLMASAFRKLDEIPETWRCDSDCTRISHYIFCPGECNIKKDSEEICPFFIDESII